jgi:hypothetical protein
MFLWSCAAGAGRDCAPAALVGLGRPAPHLHRWTAVPRLRDIGLFSIRTRTLPKEVPSL